MKFTMTEYKSKRNEAAKKNNMCAYMSVLYTRENVGVLFLFVSLEFSVFKKHILYLCLCVSPQYTHALILSNFNSQNNSIIYHMV